ncbi:hypothetical protein [Leifsonia sp. AG29]|uniref:hypothetical protein n=1 Tax=Leifsonia sp. AG29 TaxID=2598860 RepID=UPI00131D3E07|nr:hypothetical protein [Leifsonia sp. AG29]
MTRTPIDQGTRFSGSRRIALRLGYGLAAMAVLGWAIWSGLPWAPALIAWALIDIPSILAGWNQPHEPRMMPERAVPYYNALHYLLPPVIATAGAAFAPWPVLTAAFAGWLLHVLLDRTVGYDLRNARGEIRTR